MARCSQYQAMSGKDFLVTELNVPNNNRHITSDPVTNFRPTETMCVVYCRLGV